MEFRTLPFQTAPGGEQLPPLTNHRQEYSLIERPQKTAHFPVLKGYAYPWRRDMGRRKNEEGNNRIRRFSAMGGEVGALAVGALAFGALAVSALAIGRLAIFSLGVR